MAEKAMFWFKRRSKFKRSLMLHTMTDNLKEALVSMRDSQEFLGIPPEVRHLTSYRINVKFKHLRKNISISYN